MDTNSTPNASFFRFEDLRIYSKSIDYTAWLMTCLANPNTENERNLCRSFGHSSYDIALNIAEGSSRNKSQFEHCLKISKTAIRECIVYTEVARKLNLLSEADAEHSRELLMELTRMIGALIISLERGGRRHSDNDSERPASLDDDPLDSIDTNF